MSTLTLMQHRPSIATLWQVLRFAGVGLIATLVHIVVALIAHNQLALEPVWINLIGFSVAFYVSFVGHARFTFQVNEPSGRQFCRFLVLSLLSLALSSAITVIVTRSGGSFLFAMLCMGVVVPAASFAGSKFWAFADRRK